MASFRERTRLLRNVLGWWWEPTPGRLREIGRQMDSARAEVADPFDTLSQDIMRLWPASASHHDPRWHLLSHPGAQHNANSRTKAHWRCALVMAWLEKAPDPVSQAWGRSMVMARTDLSTYSGVMKRDEHEEAALRAALRCALSLETVGAQVQVRPQGGAFDRWALGLAMAMGWQDEIQACAPSTGQWKLPGVQPALWAICFDRGEVLERMIQAGMPLNSPIESPKVLFETASALTAQWGVRLSPPGKKGETREKTSFLPAGWSWLGFGMAHWLASAGARRCLDVALPHGIVLGERTEEGLTAVTVCMHYGAPDMAAAMIENGAAPVATHRTNSTNELFANACRALENNAKLRPAYLRALEAMKVSHRAKPWKAEGVVQTLVVALESAPPPALLKTLVELAPNWHGFTYGDKRVIELAMTAAREYPEAGVLQAMAGPNPGLMQSNVQHMAWGMLVAAIEAPALKGWLAHAGATEKQQLANFKANKAIVLRRTTDKDDNETNQGEIMKRLIERGDRLPEVVLRAGEPVAGLEAIMSDPIMGPIVRADTALIGRLWEQAMVQSDKGSHKALEAVVKHIPSPAWSAQDEVSAWTQLLSKPRNEALVQQTIQACPVQVRVNPQGDTPLHIAMAMSDASAVEWLAAAGADPDSLNMAGRSARSMGDEGLLGALARGQAARMQEAVVEVAAAPVRPVNRF